MSTLLHADLQWAMIRCPKELLAAIKSEAFKNRVYVGGGFIRACIGREDVNDVDVFVDSKETAEALAELLVKLRLRIRPVVSYEDLAKVGENEAAVKARIHRTDNALTLTCFHPVVQIIHRWTFASASACAASFDFTVCQAVFWWSGRRWESFCNDRFYGDLSAKRLVYTSPVRIEEAGGSMLRVLKYYQKGYRIPVDSLGKVIARCAAPFIPDPRFAKTHLDEARLAKVVTGLLREVDPSIDPTHVAHLPAEDLSDSGQFTAENPDKELNCDL